MSFLGEHNIDLYTNYCKLCGQSIESILSEVLQCCDPTNVIAISHTIAQRRTEKLSRKILDDVYNSNKDNDPSSNR